MNERIRKLAEQASHQSPDGYPVTIPYSKDFAEKFAELIVRECVGAVESLSPGYSDYRNQIEDAFRRDCVEEIKYRFGLNDE